MFPGPFRNEKDAVNAQKSAFGTYANSPL